MLIFAKSVQIAEGNEREKKSILKSRAALLFKSAEAAKGGAHCDLPMFSINFEYTDNIKRNIKSNIILLHSKYTN